MTETIRVSIGNEPKCHIAAEVLKSSIIRRTERDVEFTESWSSFVRITGRRFQHVLQAFHDTNRKPKSGWHWLMNRPPKLKRGTKFSSWRWWVPALYRNINPIGHAGRAIYLDSDQIVLADIAELWESLDPGYMLACVQNVDGNDYWKAPRTIIESGKQYRDKLQTSVMVMDCEACCWDFGKLAVQNTYANLMQGEWMDRSRVQELDPQWNRFGRCDDGTKLLHFSHVASQPWRSPKHPLTDMWRNELLATLRAGHLSQETLREEIARGHVHELHGDLAR